MSDTVTLPGGIEVTAEGGSFLLVSLVLGTAVLTIVFALWVALAVYRGYQRTGDRPALFLAWGIVLLTAVHTTLRFVLSTAGASLVATNGAAIASQIGGLGLILYAVYGHPERQGRATRQVAILPAFALPVLILSPSLGATEAVVVAINAVAAGLGAFVALQAGRAYRRHASHPMLYLGVGVAMLTLVPFLFEVSLLVAGQGLVGGLLGRLAELLGLVSVFYSLTRA